MTRLLLDTSAYSAFLDGHRGVQSALQEADDIALSPVVLGELQAGFLKGSRQQSNLDILRRFLESARVRILEISEETAVNYAVILDSLRKQGTPIPTNDVWIAASAMQHGLRVLTCDRHFLNVPQILTNYH